MTERRPVAFLSYVRSDDEHDGGKISQFRMRLEGEVKMQTGRSFEIFQDRNDLKWGQNWEERINKSLSDVSFLIPIITPSFFASPACRHEFETFLRKEQTLGSNRLIMPLYYVSADELSSEQPTDTIAAVLKQRQWTDWRSFRFKSFSDEDVASALALMATTLKDSMSELDSIIAVSYEKSGEITMPVAAIEPRKTETVSARLASKTAGEVTGLGYAVPEARPGKRFSAKKFKAATSHPYYVYTRRYDEVLRASEYLSGDQLMPLLRYVASQAAVLQQKYRDEIESFVLKTVGIARRPDIAITLLLDNSGSMRGAPITNLASWTYITLTLLERLEVPTEVLGFTTRSWKGGQARELWIRDRKPANPGRLNNVRHIVYKSFQDNFGDAYTNLGVMISEGLLKENIDGEALLWASSRMKAVTSSKKLLLIMTDGAPIDDSTVDANKSGRKFLENHLKHTASQIKAEGVDLKAIGIPSNINFDVREYYEDAFQVDEAEALGLAILNTLVTKLLQE